MRLRRWTLEVRATDLPPGVVGPERWHEPAARFFHLTRRKAEARAARLTERARRERYGLEYRAVRP